MCHILSFAEHCSLLMWNVWFWFLPLCVSHLFWLSAPPWLVSHLHPPSLVYFSLCVFHVSMPARPHILCLEFQTVIFEMLLFSRVLCFGGTCSLPTASCYLSAITCFPLDFSTINHRTFFSVIKNKSLNFSCCLPINRAWLLHCMCPISLLPWTFQSQPWFDLPTNDC